MTRGVYEIEQIFSAVFRLVVECDGVRLDGDASLFFELHIVKELIGHIAQSHGIRLFEQTVGESRFAVVNMRYYTEISYIVFFKCQVGYLFYGQIPAFSRSL